MAREIHSKHHDEIPSEIDDLKSLSGVSDYIAAAVLSLAHECPVPILDTNTIRIIGRVFGRPVSDSSRRSEDFRILYKSIMDNLHPREFNLAMLDLAALVCFPVNPNCDRCPIQSHCEYGRTSGERN
jgi:A/G-specific adenine glycosylase